MKLNQQEKQSRIHTSSQAVSGGSSSAIFSLLMGAGEWALAVPWHGVSANKMFLREELEEKNTKISCNITRKLCFPFDSFKAFIMIAVPSSNLHFFLEVSTVLVLVALC